MGLNLSVQNLGQLDGLIEPMLRAARIPGAAVAIVLDGSTAFAQGYGYRDLAKRLPVTPHTVYPIASTTKAMNATLVGMFVEEGLLDWDVPVQTYIPWFGMHDPAVSSQVTLRDLLSMRTGLPRHDFVWYEQPIERADLVKRMRYLELSAGFRERFQYNNLTSTTAGFVAEQITGQSWEDLAQKRIFEPLGMSNTGRTPPPGGNTTLSYHENAKRELVLTRRLSSEVTAPSGGAIHSTVLDMARWIAFNLNGGMVGGRALIQPQTFTELQTPQVTVRAEPSAPTPNASYAMGWFVDTYNGCARITHGGYLHDVQSEVTLYPQDGIGVVSFINFGCPGLAGTMNQYAFDLIKGFAPVQTFDEKLAQYEKKIGDARVRLAAVRRLPNSAPSHALDNYAGAYLHPGYGFIEIYHDSEGLVFERNNLVLPLEHWHYDAWVVKDSDLFGIHMPHVFDRASRILFESDADGEIAAFSMKIEPALSPIRFKKQASASK